MFGWLSRGMELHFKVYPPNLERFDLFVFILVLPTNNLWAIFNNNMCLTVECPRLHCDMFFLRCNHKPPAALFKGLILGIHFLMHSYITKGIEPLNFLFLGLV